LRGAKTVDCPTSGALAEEPCRRSATSPFRRRGGPVVSQSHHVRLAFGPLDPPLDELVGRCAGRGRRPWPGGNAEAMRLWGELDWPSVVSLAGAHIWAHRVIWVSLMPCHSLWPLVLTVAFTVTVSSSAHGWLAVGGWPSGAGWYCWVLA